MEGFRRTLRRKCPGWRKDSVSETAELQKDAQEYLDFCHHAVPLESCKAECHGGVIPTAEE